MKQTYIYSLKSSGQSGRICKDDSTTAVRGNRESSKLSEYLPLLFIPLMSCGNIEKAVGALQRINKIKLYINCTII